MRVSLRKDDPAFDRDAQYDVYLDGVPIHHVITADEELGEVLCKAIDDDGQFVIDGENFVDVLHRGVVEIKPRASVSSEGSDARAA